MNVPNIPIPGVFRVAMLRRAIWDLLRRDLSYDQAKAVQAEAEARVEAVLVDILKEAKR